MAEVIEECSQFVSFFFLFDSNTAEVSESVVKEIHLLSDINSTGDFIFPWMNGEYVTFVDNLVMRVCYSLFCSRSRMKKMRPYMYLCDVRKEDCWFR